MKSVSSLSSCLLVLILSPVLFAAPEVIFRETFADPKLPGWQAQWKDAKVSFYSEMDGSPALRIERDAPGLSMARVFLPAEKVAGKLIVIDAMVRADHVKTGAAGYHSGKLMLRWSGPFGLEWMKGDKPDMQGTFDWVRRRYAVEIPTDATSVQLSIGLEECTGQVSYSNLSVYTDPSIRSVASLEKQVEAEESGKVAEALKNAEARLEFAPGGAPEVYCGKQRIPRNYWTDSVRTLLLKTPVAVEPKGDGAASVLSRLFSRQAVELVAGIDKLSGQALNDRVCEIAGLRRRAASLSADVQPGSAVTLGIEGKPLPVSPLVFGSNLNWGEFDMVLDHKTGKFTEPFYSSVHAMRLTSLRYPGGCNADTFDWHGATGPMDQRPVQDYYNRSYKATVHLGVDEFLRYCEAEKITPVMTTAFLKDTPQNVLAQEKKFRQEWILDYLKTAPERVQLAADWVEYCNGSVETPMGKLRAQNGHPAPYNVTYWEVGNETWGADPVGTCSAEAYATAFPRYVEAMKKRDPRIQVILNGHSIPNWSDKVLKIAGSKADMMQIHIYIGGGAPSQMAAQSWFSELMTAADQVDTIINRTTDLMMKNVGHKIPLLITEYGMGVRGGPNIMASMGTAVMVADMIRQFVDHPDVVAAHRWVLYENYYFSSLRGPSRGKERPYGFRPDYGVFLAYAACRGDSRYAVIGETRQIKAVIFDRGSSYGVVLINRSAEDFIPVRLDLPGTKVGSVSAVLQTAAHALTGADLDGKLAQAATLDFAYNPKEGIPVPANSVLGLVIPK